MKLNGLNYSIPLFVVFFFLNNTQVHAGAMGPVQIETPTKVYFGVFGGGGSSNKVSINQYGTAFFFEDVGGPLAVNSFGSDSRSLGIVGGQLGYQWAEPLLNLFAIPWNLSPTAELEGFYMGKSSFITHEINSANDRLDEHDFLVSYPTNAGVFLANAVLNFNSQDFVRWHPYVGAGIGGAVLSITNADSLQTAPPEVGVNHYNSNPNDKVGTFAGQVKVGLNFDLCEHLNVFAEYRWLYLANTSFTFGSTSYPGHAVTSPWTVNFGSQQYNLGAAGVRFSI